MKVGIIVDVEPGIHGGIATALRSLITALGKLDGPETYVLIVENQNQVDWLSPLAANQKFEMRPASSGNPVRDLLRSLKGMANKALGRDGRVGWPQVPISDGWLESLGLDVLHQPTQGFIYCAIPTVYNPHDLQHLHYPQFFDLADLTWRETIYRAACRTSHAIIVNSQWIKDDVVAQFAVNPDKVQIIPEAAPTQLLAEVSEEDKASTRAKVFAAGALHLLSEQYLAAQKPPPPVRGDGLASRQQGRDRAACVDRSPARTEPRDAG